jgi:hypothetical protein
MLDQETKSVSELLDEAIARIPEMDRLREEHHRRHRKRVELQQQIQERWQKLFANW